MEAARLAPAFLGSILLSGCITYSTANLNMSEYEAAGVNGMPMTAADPSAENLGPILASKRTWLFGSCEKAAEAALERLASVARARGAERVSRIRFRGRWEWREHPVCRRNLAHGMLVLPVLLPISTFLQVGGIAE
jgi:hypothetical protein